MEQLSVVPSEVAAASRAAIEADFVNRDRQLLQSVQSMNETLNARGVLHSSIQTGAITDLFIAELQPRADFIGQSYYTAFNAFAKSSKPKDINNLVSATESDINAEFERLVTVYSGGLLTLEKDTEAKRLRAALDIPRQKAISELRVKLAMKAEPVSVLKRIKGPAWALVLAVVSGSFAIGAVYLANQYTIKNEEAKQRLATEKEVRDALVAKLEMFRTPNTFVKRASEAKSEGDYSREMMGAIRATDLALDSLSSGYPLMQTRVTQAFGAETSASVDSIGKEAVLLRDALQASLDALRQSFSMQPPETPGENLAAAEALEVRVNRVEKRLYK
jgi:hypothetical protein